MGTIIAKDCVRLEDLQQEIFIEYETAAYTVVKSDGYEESGWRLSRISHRCIFNREGWQAAHALIIDGEWRVFLYHDTFPELSTHTPIETAYYTNKFGSEYVEHSCGWRRVGTFWPTLLSGDIIGIDQWQATLVQRLRALQSRKLSEAIVSPAPKQDDIPPS